MADHPINFAEQRALANEDNSLWSPRDCIAAVLRDIDSGKIAPTAVMIHYYEPDGDGQAHNFYLSNLNFPEHIAMLNVALWDTMERWKK